MIKGDQKPRRLSDYKEGDGWIYERGTRRRPSLDGAFRLKDFDLNYRSPDWLSSNASVKTLRGIPGFMDHSFAKDFLRGHFGNAPEGGEVFNKVMNFVFKVEGGYVNDANDSGGATKYGITHATYDAWRLKNNLPVRNVNLITKLETSKIYYDEYWLKSYADKYSYELALVVFDIAVNSGVYKAKKLKNKATNNVGSGSNDIKIASEILKLRKNFYTSICQDSNNITINKNYKKKRFSYVGWINRIEKLCKEINIPIFWTTDEIKNRIKGWGIHAKSTPKYDW